VSIVAISDETLRQATKIIQEGGLVAIPTETVYGLGCNALNENAVQKVFLAKGRPAINPLIVHVASIAEAQKLAVMNETAEKIASLFWPGPLTLILPQKEGNGISPLCTAGLKTIAIRFPEHEVARKLIQMSGVPIAAPSANASGEVSPTSPRHVYDSLGDKVDMILAGGTCRAGLESTVIDVTGDTPVVLRYGVITKEDISKIVGLDVLDGVGQETHVSSPGQLLKHYAPTLPIRLNAIDVEEGEALLAFGGIKFMGIRSGGGVSSLPDDQMKNLSETADLEEAAHNLFAYMRDLDNPKFKAIAVMNIPNEGVGQAINDRLTRAAQR